MYNVIIEINEITEEDHSTNQDKVHQNDLREEEIKMDNPTTTKEKTTTPNIVSPINLTTIQTPLMSRQK